MALDRVLTVTIFSSASASSKVERKASLRNLVPLFADTRASSKAALPWIKLAQFGDVLSRNGSYRHDGNLIEIHGVEADYDGEQISIASACATLERAGVAAVIYASPSHTDALPRWRVMCPTSRPMAPHQRAALVARINGLFAGALARESFVLSQSYYYGALQGAQAHVVRVVEGRAIDLCPELDSKAVRPTRAARAAASAIASLSQDDVSSAYGLSALDSECQAIMAAGDGSKHAAVNKAGYAIGGLVAAGELDHATARNALSAAVEGIRHRCKDFGAAQRTLARALADGQSAPRERPPMQIDIAHEAVEAILADRAVDSVPDAIMDVDGALKMFVDWCQATAISRQPFLALAAGICAIGALAGRRYRTQTNLRTNIYAIGVADSGAGKDHARKRIKQAFSAAGLTSYLGGEDIASGAAMLTALQRHPAMLFQIDEFGDWLSSVLGKHAPAHRKAIAEKLKTLYSSVDSYIGGTEYANQSKDGRPREDIQQPHACLYGTTTPEQFWTAVQAASLHDGLLARVLIFVSPESYPDLQTPNDAPPPSRMIAAFQAIARGVDDGNLAQVMSANLIPTPHLVTATADAEAAMEELQQYQLREQRKAAGTYMAPLVSRLHASGVKLAMVRAISRDPTAPLIEARDVAWGRAVVEHCINSLLREAGNNVSDNAYQASINKACNLLRKHGPMSEYQLMRRGLWMKDKDRAELLRTMVDSGCIIPLDMPSGPKGGRPCVRYQVTDEVAQLGT